LKYVFNNNKKMLKIINSSFVAQRRTRSRTGKNNSGQSNENRVELFFWGGGGGAGEWIFGRALPLVKRK
jgi:hypothetical protein